MTILVWIFRLIVLIVLIRFVLRLVSNATSARPPAQPPRSKATERLGGALVRDPHCGTYVPKARALTSGSGGTTLYFCSPECRDAHAVAASPAASARHAAR